jgi:predicted alpha/beta-fold hydrolase
MSDANPSSCAGEHSPDPPFLPDPYRAAWWLPGGHLQTLAGKYLRRCGPLRLIRERWDTPDGDFLDLDFGPDPGMEAPMVLILHGLEGFSRRPYMLQAMEALANVGLATAALNFRGCSGEPNRKPRLYHSGETGDPTFVLDKLRDRWPTRRFGALGYSLGGNILLKLLGERTDGGRSLLQAAAAISVPYDLDLGASVLERGVMGPLYTRYFLQSLKGKIQAKENLLRPILDLEAVYSSRTIREFDHRATGPLHGFRGAEDYYELCSSNQFLPRIRVPALLVHARNDPFLPAQAIPEDAMAENPCLTPAVTPTGGHVGFLSGPIPGLHRFWGEAQAVRFFRDKLG